MKCGAWQALTEVDLLNHSLVLNQIRMLALRDYECMYVFKHNISLMIKKDADSLYSNN